MAKSKKRRRRQRKRDRKCPEHGELLVSKPTMYGPRCACPVEGCTVVWWPGSPTSTPADYETRQARRRAHAAFDPLWREGEHSRSELYQRLADHMRLTPKETHIGMFSIDQCEVVVAFCQEIESWSTPVDA